MTRETGSARGRTVAALAQDWVEAARAGRDGRVPLERRTITLYDGYVRNHIVPALGAHRAGALTRRHVQAFRDELLASGLARETFL